MSIRQPLPPWVVATVLLASVVAGQMTYRLLHRADTGPRTIAELRQRLDTSDLALHVVPTMGTSEEAGVYLCTTPQPREKLQCLLRTAEFAHRWKGVVFCSREAGLAQIPEAMVRSWGEHSMRLGELLLFGDPDLLARIRAAVFPGRRSADGPPTARPTAHLVAARSNRPSTRAADRREEPVIVACYPLSSQKG